MGQPEYRGMRAAFGGHPGSVLSPRQAVAMARHFGIIARAMMFITAGSRASDR